MDDDEAPPPPPLLLLVSHARTPPLRSPGPDLTYDVRSVHNPPKAIRDKYTGVDKRLREHMLSHGDFVALLDRAEAEIKGRMRQMKDGDAEEGIVPFKEWKPPRRAPGYGGQNGAGGGVVGVDGGDGGDGEEEEEEEEDELEEEEERPTLKVGAVCVRGRHRSVAFAEELAVREWPREWEVRVVHRDLGRSKKDSRGRFNRRNSLGRGFLDDNEDD